MTRPTTRAARAGRRRLPPAPPALDRDRDQRRPQGRRPDADHRRARLPLHRPGRAAADAAAAGDPREHLPHPGHLQPHALALRRDGDLPLRRCRSRSASSTTWCRCRSAPAAPRCRGSARSALWLFIAGATVLYAGFLFTPSEAGVNPLPPLSELAFLPNNGVDAWAGRHRPGDARLRPDLDQPGRRRCARCAPRAWPGGGCRSSPGPAAIGSWLLLVIGPVMLAAITMLLIDRNFDGIFFADGSGGAPLLWQHLSWIFFTGAYMLILITALGGDRRDRPGLLPQAALQPRRGDRLAGRDRRDRHARLDAEHAHRADRDRLDVLRDADVAGADRPLRPDHLQPDRDDDRRRAADAGAAALRRRRDLGRSRSASPPRSRTRWSPSPGS